MNYAEESLKKHYEWRGKLSIAPKMQRQDQGRPVAGLYPRRGPALPGDPEGSQQEL